MYTVRGGYKNTHWSNKAWCQSNVLGQCRVVDAEGGALVGVDNLARLSPNHIFMLDDAPVCTRRLGRLQLHEAAILSLFGLAQEHNIAIYAIVSGVGVVEAEVLPWNARYRQELLVKCRARGCSAARRSWWREENRMALSEQRRADAEVTPSPHREASRDRGRH